MLASHCLKIETVAKELLLQLVLSCFRRRAIHIDVEPTV